jgi:hypothetical protein
MNARILLLLLPLALSGCAIGDGIAHVVKLAAKHSGDSSDQAATAAPAPAQPAPAAKDADLPPPPVAAPTSQIQVEDLPPPKR